MRRDVSRHTACALGHSARAHIAHGAGSLSGYSSAPGPTGRSASPAERPAAALELFAHPKQPLEVRYEHRICRAHPTDVRDLKSEPHVERADPARGDDPRGDARVGDGAEGERGDLGGPR